MNTNRRARGNVGAFFRRVKLNSSQTYDAFEIVVRVKMEQGGTLEDVQFTPLDTSRRALEEHAEGMRRSLDRAAVHIQDLADRWSATSAENSANVTKCR